MCASRISTSYKRCGTPKSLFSGVPIIIWLLISGFGFKGQKYAKSRRGQDGSGDRILSFDLKTPVWSYFLEAR